MSTMRANKTPGVEVDGRDADAGVLGYRRLWAAVLAENVRLAIRPRRWPSSTLGREKLDRRQSAEWIGSRDFHAVCALAGFDGEYVMRLISVRLANPAAPMPKVYRRTAE